MGFKICLHFWNSLYTWHVKEVVARMRPVEFPNLRGDEPYAGSLGFSTTFVQTFLLLIVITKLS